MDDGISHRRLATDYWHNVIRRQMTPERKQDTTPAEAEAHLEEMRAANEVTPIAVTSTELMGKFESIRRGDPPIKKL